MSKRNALLVGYLVTHIALGENARAALVQLHFHSFGVLHLDPKIATRSICCSVRLPTAGVNDCPCKPRTYGSNERLACSPSECQRPSGQISRWLPDPETDETYRDVEPVCRPVHPTWIVRSDRSPLVSGGKWANLLTAGVASDRDGGNPAWAPGARCIGRVETPS
jgi:hypothetical protein